MVTRHPGNHGGIGVALLSALFLLLQLPPSAQSAEQGYVEGLSTYPLREEPQFSAEPAMRLPVGQKLTILEEQQGWVKVRVGDRNGWMPTSVVGKEAPANLRLGPLQERMRELETGIGRLEDENRELKAENDELGKRVSSQAEDLEDVRRATSRARNMEKLKHIALGGGLVIFGWITGYALASAVHKPGGAKKKYIID